MEPPAQGEATRDSIAQIKEQKKLSAIRWTDKFNQKDFNVGRLKQMQGSELISYDYMYFPLTAVQNQLYHSMQNSLTLPHHHMGFHPVFGPCERL